MTSGKRTAEILKQIRAHMSSLKYAKCNLHAYIVPSSDAHGSEYLAAGDERRPFVSGFDGSAGTAVITGSEALLWTDARYHLQAESQLDAGHWRLMREGVSGVPSVGKWLASHMAAGSAVGVDPRLLSARLWSTLAAELVPADVRLTAVATNLVDLVRQQLQPPAAAPPAAPIFHHPLQYTGMTVADKLVSVRRQMTEAGCSLLVLAALDEVAYMLNLRGSDIPYNPVFFAYCAVEHQCLHVFVHAAQLDQATLGRLTEEADTELHVHAYDDIWHFCETKAAAYCQSTGDKVWLCPLASQALTAILSAKCRLHVDRTPVCLMKAVKNDREIAGMYAAHVRDAVALCRYLSWLEQRVGVEQLPVTELEGARHLHQLRAEQADFVGDSFATISAFGANAAVIHYTPSDDNETQITAESLYLVDSGGQYRDGTTDVTRTVHFGRATRHQQECFTRVLQGHIALASAVFPENTRGTLLDPVARLPLWRAGLDYGHGTGHGVGAFLNVHEGPMAISHRPQPATEPGLRANMFVSNEPGYYEPDGFGIRIENVVQVVKAETPHQYAGRQYLTFRNVTLVPIQTSLLATDLLTSGEISWLNSYHAECYRQVAPLLQSPDHSHALAWLQRNTQPLQLAA